jgi:hypothetical protein
MNFFNIYKFFSLCIDSIIIHKHEKNSWIVLLYSWHLWSVTCEISTIVPLWWPGFEPSSGNVWHLWWTKWHLGRFPMSTSVSPANSYSTIYSTLIFGAGTISQIVADIPSRLSSHPTSRNEVPLFVSVVPILKWMLDTVFSLMSAAVLF